MQHTREELADLLQKSQETLKMTRSTTRKLRAVITKVNKVVGVRRSVKRKRRSNFYRCPAFSFRALDVLRRDASQGEGASHASFGGEQRFGGPEADEALHVDDGVDGGHRHQPWRRE